MKVRNLLFGTMIALAFTACSNENDPINNGGSATTDGTTLEVSANIINTKANDATKNIVYVYDQDGNFEASGEAGTQISVKAGSKTFVVIKGGPALTDASPALTTLENSINYMSANESAEGGSQNSCIYTASCQRGKINKVGYLSTEISAAANEVDGSSATNPVILASTGRIPMYRNVALINLSSVSVETKATSDKTGAPIVYTDPTMSIDNVFVLNARANALRISSTPNAWWPTTEVKDGNFVNGVTYAQYKSWWDEATAKKAADSKVTLYVNAAQSADSPAAEQLAKSQSKTVTTTTAWTPNGGIQFVAYENTSSDSPTLLVLHGSSYKAADGTSVTESNRYWTIQLGKGITASQDFLDRLTPEFGVASFSSISGLRRNIQYNVTMTITGPGSDNPLYPGDDSKTKINAAVQLVQWGSVSQSGKID